MTKAIKVEQHLRANTFQDNAYPIHTPFFITMTRFAILGLFALASTVVNALDCNVGQPSGGDDTPQILEAIEKCAAGGTVNIPAGDYTVNFGLSLYLTCLCSLNITFLLLYSLVHPSKRKALRTL